MSRCGGARALGRGSLHRGRGSGVPGVRIFIGRGRSWRALLRRGGFFPRAARGGGSALLGNDQHDDSGRRASSLSAAAGRIRQPENPWAWHTLHGYVPEFSGSFRQRPSVSSRCARADVEALTLETTEATQSRKIHLVCPRAPWGCARVKWATPLPRGQLLSAWLSQKLAHRDSA